MKIDFADKLSRYIRDLLLIRSGMNAVAISLPALASVLAFVTYSATGHTLEPTVIFTSLTLFNLLRLPLMFLRKSIITLAMLHAYRIPAMSLSTIADAHNAIGRLYGVFEAELLEDTHVVDPNLETAIEVKGAAFTWDAPPPEEEGHKKKKRHGLHGHKKAKAKQLSAPSSSHGHSAEDDKAAEDRIFKVTDVTMSVPRGALVAIVGPVGSGKTSLLQGIIGEMRQTSGSVTFGGSVGYCSQSAWIQVRSLLRYSTSIND